MASSSSSSAPPCRTWKYDVFPSFRGEDVRKKFRSHLVMKLQSRLITTFLDDDMERSRVIRPELLSAIRESRIAIVICSKNYASSTWCLDELVEIFKCFEMQMVIPVFYEIDPSHVRKQTGEFGDVFKETCKGKTEDEKQRWIKALTDVGNITGYDSQNGRWESEAEMIEEISKEVSNRLFTTLDYFRDFVGIDAHVEAVNSKLCLESGGVRMVGIVGTSGIGKSTIARALFSRLKCQFHHQAFVSYRRNIQDKKKADFGIQLSWVKQFLSDLTGENYEKIDSLGMVEQMLNHKKVLVVLDDVNEIELLETVVRKPGWFGVGSRIIVVTQDRGLLKAHGIEHIYEVELPKEDLALEMLCQSAFGKNSPPSGFMELAVEVAELVGNLPLGLNVLGSYLRGRQREEWVEMKPRIQSGLHDKLENTLRISYDGLEKSDQDLFLYIACLFNGEGVDYINNLIRKYAEVGLKILAEKSLIRITSLPYKTVEMHILLQKLGVKIVREGPGKPRFLVDLEDIRDVLTDKTGTDKILGIRLNRSDIDEPLFLDGNSFKGMHNLQFIKIYRSSWWDDGRVRLDSPQGLDYLPRKLRLLHWDAYPGKYLPSTFRAECLVELIMRDSNLEKLWEGTHNEVYPPLRSLKKMDLYYSMHLKEIPDLSDAINLETLNLSDCRSLVTPPAVKRISKLFLNHVTKIDAEWIENIDGLTHLSWVYCPLRCMPSNFRTEHLVELNMSGSELEKLWEGVQPFENLENMVLSSCHHLKEIPDLSKAIELKKLDMTDCWKLEVLPTDVNLESLEELTFDNCSRLRSFPQISTSIKKLYLSGTAIEEVPSWIENMSNLEELWMSDCERLKDLPTDVNLVSLTSLHLSCCYRLRSFPQISTSIKELDLDETAIEEVPSWIENISELKLLDMGGCKRLKNISPSIFKLRHLEQAKFSGCSELTSFSDASVVATEARITDSLDFPSDNPKKFDFSNCSSFDPSAQQFILGLSIPMNMVLPAVEEVPTYFTHRSCGSSLNVPLPHSSPSHQVLRFKACLMIESLGYRWSSDLELKVGWRFRGLSGEQLFGDVQVMDHLLVFNFGLADFELNSHLSASAATDHKFSQSELEFELESTDRGNREFEVSSGRFVIKGCGVRVLDASPTSDDAATRISETESNQQSGEEYDAETGRSKRSRYR